MRLSKDCGFDPHQELFFFCLSPFSSPGRARVAKAGKRAPLEAPISDRGEMRRGRRIGSASDTGDAIASLARPLPELEKWNGKSHCIFDPGVNK